MKKSYFLGLFFFLINILAYSQRDSAIAYNKRANKYFIEKDFKNAFFWYEKLFATNLTNFRSNYNLYRAAVSSCQVDEPEKALSYFKEMAGVYLDYDNYPYFAGDTLNAKCLVNTESWKKAMAFMKLKYDSVQTVYNNYISNIEDTTKRINQSLFTDTGYLTAFINSHSFDTVYSTLKHFNTFTNPPKRNQWTLYHIKLSDTLTVPFLVHVPDNYNPKVKTPLYIFLHGAVSNIPDFDVKYTMTEFDNVVLKKPIDQHAFVIYPYATKYINWLYHPLAFDAITREIAFTKALYNIDDNKVYVTGHSDGGRGVFYFAINKPTDFASFLAINYFPQSLITNTALRNLRNKETFYGMSGKRDELFSFKKVDSVYQYARSIGANWKNFSIDAGHDIPHTSGDSVSFVYDTISQKQRNPFPANVEWETDNINNGRYYWIEIDKLDTTAGAAAWANTYNPDVLSKGDTSKINFNGNKSGIIQASIKDNLVTVKTSRISEFSFYVYPEMVDLIKPLVFNVNDNTFFTVKLHKDKNDLAHEFVNTKDRTLLAVQKITLGIGD